MIRACSRSRLRNPAAGSGSAFNPLSLFTAGEQGGWYDPSDMTSLFQDNLGTVPVTAADQVVGMMQDKSGNAHHATQATEASKPILRASGGLWWLEFDGVDDFLLTGVIDLTATNKMSVFAGVRKLSDAAVGMVAELSVNLNTNNGSFYMAAPNSAAPNYAFVSKGTGQAGAIGSASAPNTAVLTGLSDIAAPSTILRVSSVVTSNTGSLGSGSLGAYPLYIGRRGGTTLPFGGNLYGLIVRGATSPALTVQTTEGYMASKAGIVL